MRNKIRSNSAYWLVGTFLSLLSLTAGIDSSLGAEQRVLTKPQVLSAIKNMPLLSIKADEKSFARDEAYGMCLDKFAVDHPDNRQIRDQYAFCDTQYSQAELDKLIQDSGNMQMWAAAGVLAAQRILKTTGSFETEFVIAINFEIAWQAYESMAGKETWQVKANQLADVAKAQNLYQEGYFIAQKYSSKQAQAYLQKVKGNDPKQAKPYLLFFRKAAFLK